MSMSHLEGENTIPEDVIARNKAVLAILKAKENLDVGQHTQEFRPILHYLGGILAHAHFIPGVDSEISTFSLRQPNNSFEFITVHSENEGKYVIQWNHLTGAEHRWQSDSIRLSDGLVDDGSYGVVVAKVNVLPEFESRGEEKILVKIKINRFINTWGFTGDGNIDSESFESVNLKDVPLNAFNPQTS